MKKYFPVFLLLIIGVFHWSCQSTKVISPTKNDDPFAAILSEKVKTILQRSFDRIGGLERWNNKPALSFKKYFALYDENGTIEKEVDQIHEYRYKPEPHLQITWETPYQHQQIISHQGQFTKMLNEKVDTEADIKALEKTILTATFVVDIPFKLMDKNVDLTYIGLDTLEDQQIVEVIRATYNPDQHAHHTTPDIWWYYFDHQDYRLVAYMVQHLDHYSYVKNLSFTEEGGFLFPIKRKSYRVDQDRNILYLRADYEYEDYKVE